MSGSGKNGKRPTYANGGSIPADAGIFDMDEEDDLSEYFDFGGPEDRPAPSQRERVAADSPAEVDEEEEEVDTCLDFTLGALTPPIGTGAPKVARDDPAIDDPERDEEGNGSNPAAGDENAKVGPVLDGLNLSSHNPKLPGSGSPVRGGYRCRSARCPRRDAQTVSRCRQFHAQIYGRGARRHCRGGGC